MTEHEQKYSALVERIGLLHLRRLLPATERIRAALAAGDEHLNSIPLELWDRAAGYISGASGGSGPIRLSWAYPWTPANANRLSLAERVCILKMAAVMVANEKITV